MTHYQKITTIIFRIVGLLLITASLVMFVQNAVTVWLVPQFQNVLLSSNFSYIPYVFHLIHLIVGMILYLSARFLAIWICLDFNKFDGQQQ